MKKNTIIILFILFLGQASAQEYDLTFLDICTNTRLAGFGGVGVVSSPFYKNTGLYQNPALISKNTRNTGANFSHMPWLRNVADDISLSSLSGYYAIDSSNSFAVNFTYFDLGSIQITDEAGNPLGNSKPYELFFKVGYNHTFNSYISTGIAVKYIRSDIVFDFVENTKVVNTYAIDLGFGYDKAYNLHNNSFLNTGAGLALTNFGPKISYNTEIEEKRFIPTKLSLGLFINPDINIKDIVRLNIELGYQAEKFLVPTPPVTDINGNIIEGYDSDISSFNALYQSFYDAPGGFEEEINEIKHKFGSEFRVSYLDYGYFAFRHGRHLEHEAKGNRNYQTFGFGMGVFGFMMDYMFIKDNDNDYLNNTWSFTIGFQFNLDKSLLRF